MYMCTSEKEGGKNRLKMSVAVFCKFLAICWSDIKAHTLCFVLLLIPFNSQADQSEFSLKQAVFFKQVVTSNLVEMFRFLMALLILRSVIEKQKKSQIESQTKDEFFTLKYNLTPIYGRS